MAQKQDPPKKIMNGPKGTMTPPSRKKMLERVDKVIKKTIKQKPRTSPLKKALAQGDRSSAAESYRSMARGAVSAILPKTNALKSALAKGDKSSASSSFTARAAKKVATGAGKALKSMAPSVKIDSTKKVTPGGRSNPSIMIKKETKIRRPLVGGSIPFPVRPEKKESLKKMMK
jgi:hypothetical protein